MRVRTDLPVGSQAKNVFYTVVMPVLLLVDRIPTSLFFLLYWWDVVYKRKPLFIWRVMPLFLIVLGASGIGAAIALYILRKYDDPNTLWTPNWNFFIRLDFLLLLLFNWLPYSSCFHITEDKKHYPVRQSVIILYVNRLRYQKTYRGVFNWEKNFRFRLVGRWETFVG